MWKIQHLLDKFRFCSNEKNFVNMQPTSRTRSEERNIKELIREGQGLKILVELSHACMCYTLDLASSSHLLKDEVLAIVASQFSNSVHSFLAGILKVVHNHNLVVVQQHLQNCMTPNIACSPSHQHPFLLLLLISTHCLLTSCQHHFPIHPSPRSSSTPCDSSPPSSPILQFFFFNSSSILLLLQFFLYVCIIPSLKTPPFRLQSSSRVYSTSPPLLGTSWFISYSPIGFSTLFSPIYFPLVIL